jgi:dTDP-4-dehydrorhamnose 3,5-epimerase
MKFIETKLHDVYIVEQDVFTDERGSFVKTFQKSHFISKGLDCDFRESYYTHSKKNVIRGMHFQTPPYEHAKLVTVMQGTMIDVILDLRKNSPTYNKHISVELSRNNARSVYIPKGCAHGFGTLSQLVIAYYMVTSEYSSKHDQGVRYDSFDFDWPIKQEIVSDRDKLFLPLHQFKSPF